MQIATWVKYLAKCSNSLLKIAQKMYKRPIILKGANCCQYLDLLIHVKIMSAQKKRDIAFRE